MTNSLATDNQQKGEFEMTIAKPSLLQTVTLPLSPVQSKKAFRILKIYSISIQVYLCYTKSTVIKSRSITKGNNKTG